MTIESSIIEYLKGYGIWGLIAGAILLGLHKWISAFVKWAGPKLASMVEAWNERQRQMAESHKILITSTCDIQDRVLHAVTKMQEMMTALHSTLSSGSVCRVEKKPPPHEQQ